MMSPLQLYFLSFLIIFLIFLVTYIIQKRFLKTKDLIWDSVFDAVTLNSAIIILIYLAGNVFNIELFIQIDNYSLYIALFFAALTIIGGMIDKLKDKKKNE